MLMRLNYSFSSFALVSAHEVRDLNMVLDLVNLQMQSITIFFQRVGEKIRVEFLTVSRVKFPNLLYPVLKLIVIVTDAL